MFSVKHITLDGTETLHQSAYVQFKPAFDEARALIKHGDELSVASVALDHMQITGGTVFVMNEAGKTVARYDLGASPVPIVGDGLTDPRPRGLSTRAA